ncbi:MAG TPA: hypothetical protein VG838_03075 [Opitutaceae bacterium]|nr:hypothetical protein [Opitutaceae bacterium]
MSTPKNFPARPVSWFSVGMVFLGFAVFLLVVKYAYLAHLPAAPYAIAPENLPADQAWKATPADRKAYLGELRAKEQTQVNSYGWVDQSKGIVRLPISRAMELTVQELSAKQPARTNPTSTSSR